MTPKAHFYAGLVLAISTLCLIGCGSSEVTRPSSTVEEHGDDHDFSDDRHEHTTAKSLGDMVAKVEKLSRTIQEAFQAGDSEKGHGPLHEIGHLLEEIPPAAANELLTLPQQQRLREAVDSLMNSFGALDEQLHGGSNDGKSFNDVATDIQEALAKLKSVYKEEPES